MRVAISRGVVLVAVIVGVQQASAQQRPQEAEAGTLPLTVVGKAIDAADRPIGGATIYLVSTNSSPWKTLGEVVTKDDGRYAFHDLSLPESRYSTSDGFRVGYFQLFGKAPGRSFAWQGMKVCYVKPPHPSPGTLDYYRRRGFASGETIELDLTFADAQRVHGRFVDELGMPISGVRLQLIFCDSAHTYLNLSDKEWRSFYSIHQAAEVMPDQVVATTDAAGNFEFTSVRPNALCELMVEHPDHASIRFFATTASTPPQSAYDGRPIRKVPVEMTLRSVRTISVSVIDADGGPLAGVRVRGHQFAVSGIHSGGVSDEEGKAVLKLPPGEYQLEGRPPKEVACIVTARDLTVEESPDAQSVALRMDPGCVLILKAIDVESSKGIPDVKFWIDDIFERPGGRVGRGRGSVQSTTSAVDNPKTDANGVLRAVVRPGRRRFGIGWDRLPEGYEFADESDRSLGRQVVLPAGQEVTELFPLRKTTK
jgi:hypothetical protein